MPGETRVYVSSEVVKTGQNITRERISNDTVALPVEAEPVTTLTGDRTRISYSTPAMLGRHRPDAVGIFTATVFHPRTRPTGL